MDGLTQPRLLEVSSSVSLLLIKSKHGPDDNVVASQAAISCPNTMLVFLFLAQHVLALGESCTLANNRLDPSTHKFHSDCEPTEYCASSANRAPWLATPSSAALAPVATTYDDPPITDLFRRDTATTCQPRGCRSDEDPFGYDVTVTPLPPKCGIDEFCPDEGSTCQDLVLLGGACQFDRDGAPDLTCRSPPHQRQTSVYRRREAPTVVTPSASITSASGPTVPLDWCAPSFAVTQELRR